LALYEKALKGTYLSSERSWIDLKEAADECGEEGQDGPQKRNSDRCWLL